MGDTTVDGSLVSRCRTDVRPGHMGLPVHVYRNGNCPNHSVNLGSNVPNDYVRSNSTVSSGPVRRRQSPVPGTRSVPCGGCRPQVGVTVGSSSTGGTGAARRAL